ncbi:MAG: hypothetical protein ACR2JY_15835 [Chloroflexota bacterium]
MMEPAPALPPRRKRSVISRILRFPLKMVLLAIAGFFMAIRRHPRVSTSVVALLIVAGGVAYYFTPAIAPTAAVTSTSTSVGLSSVQGLLPSPQAPVEFFKAQQSGDANTMWGLLSDSYKQGLSMQQLQAQLTQIQPKMGAITHVSYVGGTKEQDGNGVYLYLLTLDQGGQPNQVTYLFTLDPQGKIVKIE